MKCQICNTINDQTSRFCIKCGTPLKKVATKICSNGHVYDSSQSSCPYCPSQGVGTETFNPGMKKPVDFDKTKIIPPSGDVKGASNFKKTMIMSSDKGSDGLPAGSPVRKIIGWLVTFSNKPEGEDFKIYEGRNTIGGSPTSDIYINDPAVSTPHCLILYRSGKLRVKDELSTNGTLLNEVEIDEAEISDGDILKIGSTELKFRSI